MSQTGAESAKKIAEFKDAFDLLEKSEMGISVKELEILFRSLNLAIGEQELKDMIASVDKDKSGVVELPSIMSLISERIKAEGSEGELMQAFRVFDPTGTGKVKTGELRYVLMNIGNNVVDPDEVNDFLKDADNEDKGEIKYEEFVKRLFEPKK